MFHCGSVHFFAMLDASRAMKGVGKNEVRPFDYEKEIFSLKKNCIDSLLQEVCIDACFGKPLALSLLRLSVYP